MGRALITGVAGQDGSYLADLLLAEGYEVHGTIRPDESPSIQHHWRLAHLHDQPRFMLHQIDLRDLEASDVLLRELVPDECYHLACTRRPILARGDEAQLLEGALATTHAIVAALHASNPRAGFFFAASSEILAVSGRAPCDEATPMDPRSIYGIAKAAGLQLVRYYREEMGLRSCSGILFNHESARRGHGFVTRKISAGAARIKLGLDDELRLGELDARRDWGHARSFAKAITLMVRLERPEDLVIATGRTHSVRDFVETAFAHLGLDYHRHVVEDHTIPRSARIGLAGNPARAEMLLGWRDGVPFPALVAEMVDDDLARLTSRPGTEEQSVSMQTANRSNA